MSALPKLSELTPEQKRIMCAEACGTSIKGTWHCPRCHEDLEWTHVSYDEKHSIDSCLCPVIFIEATPYHEDLNAMALAEATLADDEHFLFREELSQQCVRDVSVKTDSDYHRSLQSRTAAQRLDAWLLARGLVQP